MKHADHGSHATSTSSRMSHGGPGAGTRRHPYRLLAAMMVLMFVVMYGLMYAMVDRFAQIYHSLNQVYMAALMTGAMLLLELGIMRHMYPSLARNALAVVLSFVLLATGWFGLREQWGIGNRQFLRSMIPHHSGALLMCGEATVTDERIRALCGEIQSSQQREIELMEQLLAE